MFFLTAHGLNKYNINYILSFLNTQYLNEDLP